MPKMKTKAAAKKRFVMKKSGKVKAYSSGRRHLLTKKSTKRKRHLRHSHYIGSIDRHAVVCLLPYC